MFSTLHSTSDFNVDTHTLLAELDRSLRSSSIGDQCEGIVKVPSMFERYPFPILINSAALKLSEVYCNGSNFLRILILQVFKESEKHLDKILNIDEFVRHLFAVSYSNDPFARSITLQTLGHIARIISNNKNIHIFIRNSLESNDEVEVRAAMEASVKFASQSKEFVQNIYPKVIDMIEGLTTPMNIKICLLEVINNLHHNFALIEDARKKLISFFSKYPEKNFVCENLHTLTSITSSSIIHISDQVELLLTFYTNDPRSTVKLSALHDLKNLAKEKAHLWEKESITKFINLVFVKFEQNSIYSTLSNMDSKELKLLCHSLAVLSELFGSPSIFIDNSLVSSENISKIVNFSTQIICQSTLHKMFEESLQILLISKCFAILTNICLHINPKFNENINVLQETCCAYESYFLSKFISELDKEKNKDGLKEIFHGLTLLCNTRESDPSQVQQITEALRFVFLNSKPNNSWYEMICETICSLSYVINRNQSLTHEDILEIIKSQKSKKKLSAKNDRIVIKLFTIYFQLKNDKAISVSEAELLVDCLSKHNVWICYKIVRAAMRFGQHIFASQLLKRMKPSTDSIENSYIWINSLFIIANAEANLLEMSSNGMRSNDFLTVQYNMENFEHQLLTVISYYSQGLSYLKATVTNVKPMRFQCEYIKLRLKYIQAHNHFRQCCQMLLSSSTPSSTLINSLSGAPASFSDELLRYSRTVSSMQKCSQKFRSISDNYNDLYQSSFDADPHTLSNIQLLQHSCTIFAELIENLFQQNIRINSMFIPAYRTSSTEMDISKIQQTIIFEQKELENVCASISDLVKNGELKSLAIIDSKQNNNGKEFFELFFKQIDMLMRISTRLLLVPLSFPRFFFQAIQSTSIKLELSSQRNSGDTINIGQSTQFVLYVEGVVITNHSGSKTSFLKFSNSNLMFDYKSTLKSLKKQSSTEENRKKRKVFRKVNKILLTLNAVPLNTINPVNDMITGQSQSTTINMQSMVVPVNDYFHTHFLLSFHSVGLYNISVETSIIDENEAHWKSGPIQSITAKVMEDFKAN